MSAVRGLGTWDGACHRLGGGLRGAIRERGMGGGGVLASLLPAQRHPPVEGSGAGEAGKT